MRRPSPRLGERFARAVDTDPIDLRDIRRAAPPRSPIVHQPFAGGRRPDLIPAQSRLTVIGAPIPDADIADPEPPRHHWTPRRRRQVTATALTVLALVAVLVVVLAAASVLRDAPTFIG